MVLNRPLTSFLGEHAGGLIFRRGSDVATLVEDLEQHPEDLSVLHEYWRYLRVRKAQACLN
jgi:hypothetical protein